MPPLKTNRPVYKIRSRMFEDIGFPLKLRPQNDELLSSWIIRLSLFHRTLPMTFTNLYLPESRNRFWSADIDLQANLLIITLLSRKSGLPVEVLRAMTLRSYEGYLFEEVHGDTGSTPFINPLGMRGRRNSLPGLRYCPLCLSEDEQPYYRKKWRLAFSVLCMRHRCYLLNSCPVCRIPLTPYLSCKAGSANACYKCGAKLGAAEILSVQEDVELLNVVERLYAVLDDGYAIMDGTPIQSHLYFRIFHQLLRLLMSRRYGQRLQEGVGINTLEVSKYKTFESIPIRNQARMLIKTVWLLNEWPKRFIDVCNHQKLFSSVLLKDLEPTPFWYWRIVVERLYHPDTVVTAEEIREAVRFMGRRGMPITEVSLSKILGVSQILRNRIMKLGDLMQ